MTENENHEALETEREKLFEVFKAGYKAATEAYAEMGYLQEFEPNEIAEAFNDWLQEQVEEVDVLGWSSEESRTRRLTERLQRLQDADASFFTTAVNETTDPSEIFGPMDWAPLGEDVTGHCMFGAHRHDDGRTCYHHLRLGAWTFENTKRCLREHPDPHITHDA